MTSPIDGSVPYAAPPKYGPEVIGDREWAQQMAAHRLWLDSKRTTSAGAAGGGETESEQTGSNPNDDNADTQPDDSPEQENPPVKTNKRSDSGKPGTFNVYASDDEGKEFRVGGQVQADSPAEAIAKTQDDMLREGSITDPNDLQNWRTTRLRGSSVKSDTTAKLDGAADQGDGQGDPSDEPGQDGEGQGQSQDPQPDDIILHRLQSAPLIGQDAEKKIADIAEQVVGPQMQQLADTIVSGMPEQSIDEEAVKAIVEDLIKDSAQASVQVIKFTAQDKPEVTLEGHYHPVFGEALRVLSHSLPLFLYGPSGTGKTFMAEQLAAALFPDMPENERYYGISATMGMSESQLQGWRLPLSAGEFVYVPSEFVKRFEHGGLFLLDEVDRSDPNVLAVLNQAIANKRMPLPTRFEKPFAIMHENFRIMCAGNTAGTGADRLYSAATRLDEAFLDRFRAGTMFMDYDTTLEQNLVGDTLLLKSMWVMRDRCSKLRIERVVSTRVICDLHNLFDGSTTTGTKKALKRLQETWEPAEVSKCNPTEIMQQVAA